MTALASIAVAQAKRSTVTEARQTFAQAVAAAQSLEPGERTVGRSNRLTAMAKAQSEVGYYSDAYKTFSQALDIFIHALNTVDTHR